MHVGEADYGVAVANDSTYGHDVTRITPSEHARANGTMIRLSLLRAPVFPDPHADLGEHTLNVSVRVGAAIGDAVRKGYRRNLPLRAVEQAARPVDPDFAVAEVVETDLLERPVSGEGRGLVAQHSGTAVLELRPFQLVTLRYRRDPAGA